MADEADTAKIQCITDLKPWADVLGGDGKATLRQLSNDETATVPRDGALERLKKNRHVVEIR